ncbi:hypothetical protein HMPREF1586_01279 [Gardnerella vaginalis JCP8522]|nr:hypothetical protein HMPREF1586_01279 [Gardnerella vaginalis JCP8522]
MLRFASSAAKNLESLQCLVMRILRKHLFVLPDFIHFLLNT